MTVPRIGFDMLRARPTVVLILQSRSTMSPGDRTLISMASASHTKGLPSAASDHFRPPGRCSVPFTGRQQLAGQRGSVGQEALPFQILSLDLVLGFGWVRSVLGVGGLQSVVGFTHNSIRE